MWRCCWDTGRKPWLSRLLLPISRMHWGYSCDLRNSIMAAPLASLKIQWIPHKQQLSESDAGNAYEQWLRSCGWTTVVPPREASCWGSTARVTEPAAAQEWDRQHPITLTSPAGQVFEPAQSCTCDHRQHDKQPPMKPGSAKLSHTKALSSLGKMISGKHDAFHHAVVLFLAG